MKFEVAVGIDIGGTNTAIGFVSRDGQCLYESSVPTNSTEPAPVLIDRLHVLIQDEVDVHPDKYVIKGIGIGAPNGNYLRGTVENAPNLHWGGAVNLVELFARHYDLPIKVTNDANAAAIGEMLFGAAQHMKDFIVITLGTGLGSGIVVAGNLVYGHDGFAGELGHTIVDPMGRQCGCGRRGCLETYASAGGICRTVFELLAESKEASSLRGISFDDLTARSITDAARQGDSIALKAFDLTGKILGLKLADAVAHTSPEAIILFGGLANAGDLIFAPTKRHMEEQMLNIFTGKVKLLPSGLTNRNVAVLGASALIWSELENSRAAPD
jgi:glucokinase